MDEETRKPQKDFQGVKNPLHALEDAGNETSAENNVDPEAAAQAAAAQAEFEEKLDDLFDTVDAALNKDHK